MLDLVYFLCHSCKGLFAITEDSEVHLHVLIDFAGVDVEMDDLRLLGIGVEVTRHTVVESHSDSNQQVALVGLYVRSEVSVHTQHTHIQRMVGWQV